MGWLSPPLLLSQVQRGGGWPIATVKQPRDHLWLPQAGASHLVDGCTRGPSPPVGLGVTNQRYRWLINTNSYTDHL